MATGYTRKFNDASQLPGFSFGQGVDAGPREMDGSRTFMQELLPNTEFQAPQINASSMMRTASRDVADLPQLQANVAAARTDVLAVKGDFEQNWQMAQNELLQTVLEVAAEQGHSPGATLSTLIPDNAPTKMTAAASIITDMATGGGGSFVTFAAQGLSGMGEIHAETKKLSPREAEALMEEVHQRLVSQAASREHQQLFAGTNGSEAQDTHIHWENLSASDMADFLAARPEDQPEMVELDTLLAELDAVEENHQLVEENRLAGTDNQIDAAIERGDTEALTAMIGADQAAAEAIMADPETPAYSAAEVGYQSDTLAYAVLPVTEAPELDAPTIEHIASTLHHEPKLDELLENENRMRLSTTTSV